MTARPDVRQLFDLVLDAGSFRSWDVPPVDPSMSRAYAADLAAARERTGLDEAVLTGEASIRGRRVAVLGCEFSFLAGSIGLTAAERLVCAVERATAEGLPLLAAPVSGGTRMQEGTAAFVQMVKITAAIEKHKSQGLPYLVYLRHPTTGGVFASWGSLGHLTFAEPGALVGFLGPRVYAALNDKPFPSGVQTSENLLARGLIDAVVDPGAISQVLDQALNVLCASRNPPIRPSPLDALALPETPAWDSIIRSRREDRPGVRQLLGHAARDVVVMHGTGEGERDPGLLLALARFGEAPCVLVGQDRSTQTKDAPMGPHALRQARRGMRLAAQLNLPLVTVLDTPGAALSVEAEEGGLAAQIARCLSDLVGLSAPVVAVILGSGTGGGAIALLPGDRAIAAEHGWLSPLPPEGASALVHRDTAHAAVVAQRQGVRSRDLLANKIVDRVVPEYPDAADETEKFCRRVGRVLEHELAVLLHQDDAQRMGRRSERFRRLGMT